MIRYSCYKIVMHINMKLAHIDVIHLSCSSQHTVNQHHVSFMAKYGCSDSWL